MYYVEKSDLKGFRSYFSVLHSTLYLTRICRHDENSDKIRLLSTDGTAVTSLRSKTVVILAVRISKSCDLYWPHKSVCVAHACMYFR